jgi:hypothetical protein
VFDTRGFVSEVKMCNIIFASLYLREGNISSAKAFFETTIKLPPGYSQLTSYCLERLGNPGYWGTVNWFSSWTTVFLVHSLKSKDKLGIHKALQFLGDIFLAHSDEHTAISLFTVALDGFTYMDVHHSRAECMLRLGDISKGHGNMLKAMELWETARLLFEQSSQTKQVKHVDQRLAHISENVLENHRTNLVRLAQLNVPDGNVEDMDDLDNMEGLDLDDDKKPDFVAV